MLDYTSDESVDSTTTNMSETFLNFLTNFMSPDPKFKFNKVSPESPRRKRPNRLWFDEEVEVVENSDLLFNGKDFNLDWVFEVIIPKLNKNDLEVEVASELVRMAAEEFRGEGLLVDLDFTFEGTEYQKCKKLGDGSEEIETIVVGDVHGQYEDVLLIFKRFGRPGPFRRYIFNGDVVDRGPRSVACWLVLCALKISVPSYLYVTRGNHESRSVGVLNSSFAQECGRMYPPSFYVLCQNTFDQLPVSYLLNKSIFVILIIRMYFIFMCI